MGNCHVKQITSLISSVPVNSARRTPNDIADVQLLRLAALVANPTRSGGDFEDLAVLVVVPVCSSTRSEHDVVNGDAFFLDGEDGIGPDITGEGGTSEFGGLSRRAGVADNCHRHDSGLRIWIDLGKKA